MSACRRCVAALMAHSPPGGLRAADSTGLAPNARTTETIEHALTDRRKTTVEGEVACSVGVPPIAPVLHVAADHLRRQLSCASKPRNRPAWNTSRPATKIRGVGLP